MGMQPEGIGGGEHNVALRQLDNGLDGTWSHESQSKS